MLDFIIKYCDELYLLITFLIIPISFLLIIKKYTPIKAFNSCKKIWKDIQENDSKWYEIDPNKSIHSHLLFWLAILIPCYIALVLAFPLFLEHDLQLNADGYTTFFDISKVPLGILAFTIPLSLLVIRMHGSKQTAEQLSNQKDQLDKQDTQLKNQDRQLTIQETQLENQGRQLTIQEIQLENQQKQLDNQKSSDSFKHFLEHREYIIKKLEWYQSDKNKPHYFVRFNYTDQMYQSIFPELKPTAFNFDELSKPSKFLTSLRKEVNKITIDFLDLNIDAEADDAFGDEWAYNTQETYGTEEAKEIDLKKQSYITTYFNKIGLLLRSYGIHIESKISIIYSDGSKSGEKIMMEKEGFVQDGYDNVIKFINNLNFILRTPQDIDEFKDDEDRIGKLSHIWTYYIGLQDSVFQVDEQTDTKDEQ